MKFKDFYIPPDLTKEVIDSMLGEEIPEWWCPIAKCSPRKDTGQPAKCTECVCGNKTTLQRFIESKQYMANIL